MQRSDSPARSVPGYWLGDPSAGFRWPFDWTFAAWRVWAGLIIPLAFLLVFAIPAAALLVFAAWRFGVRGQPHIPQVRHSSGRNLTVYSVAGTVLLGAFAVAPTTAWLFPLYWPVALLAAPLVSAYLTKKLRPFFDDINTPVSYWTSLLPRIARGPRAARKTYEYIPLSAMEPGIAALSDLEYLALTIDPREVIVKTAKPKAPTLQWDQWMPTDMQRGANTLAWLSSLGVGTEVTAGNVLLVKRGDVVTQVRPGAIVVQMADGAIHAMTDHAFRAEFDVVHGG